MRATSRWLVGLLAVVMLAGVVEPAEAFFSRGFRKKMARTFRPVKKVRHIRKITSFRHVFKGSSGRSRVASRRTPRRTVSRRAASRRTVVRRRVTRRR